jgi:hypothetical protein
MSGFENWPAPILRRWLLSAAAGPVIFLIGLAGRIALHDPTLLTLSTLPCRKAPPDRGQVSMRHRL